MKFKIHVQEVGGDSWWEEYDRTCTDAAAEADKIVNGTWNGNLRPGDKRREILEVVVLDARTDGARHEWEKTNLFTIAANQHHGSHDTYRCQHCGVTGKRFGLSDSIKLDSHYRAKYYQNCAEVIRRHGRFNG